MGEAMCVGVLLMAGLTVVQPPAGQPPAGSSAGSTGTVTTATATTAGKDGTQAAPATSGQTTSGQTAPGETPSAQTPQVPAGQPGGTSAPAGAPAEQATPSQPPSLSTGVRVAEPLPPARSRYLVQVMEGVLQSAVRYAAAQMNTKLQAVSPDLLQLSGAARARGFRLDGYGVFFDVEVPAALRQTMGWTARMMQQNDQTLEQAFLQLRRMATELDGKRRMDVETALKLVELRARPFLPRQQYPPMQTGGASVKATSAPNATAMPAGIGDPSTLGAGPAQTGPTQTGVAPTAAAADDLAWMQNPDGAYEGEVRDALISAMLNYGSTLALQPEEFLTVAARDNQSVVVPGDLSETVTVILRIRGRDLADLMTGRVSEQDARRRVEVREF